MDQQLRELERLAKSGDLEAQEKLKVALKRLRTQKTIKCDWSKYISLDILLDADDVFLEFVAPKIPKPLRLVVKQDRLGKRKIIWPVSILWTTAHEPMNTQASGAIDVFTFFYNAPQYYGQASLNFS